MPVGFFTEEQTLHRDEGVFCVPWTLKRTDLCKRICEIVDDIGLLLVRGPFASGKTALAQLLQYHLREKGEIAYAIQIQDVKNREWESAWLKKAEVPWEAVTKSTRPVYVIIDEVQESYSPTTPINNLWAHVKSANSARIVRYICIGAYGDPEQAPTPSTLELAPSITLHPHNGTPGLKYTSEEFRDLCKLFEAYCQRLGRPIKIDETSANYIYHLTGEHPGFIGLTFRNIHTQKALSMLHLLIY